MSTKRQRLARRRRQARWRQTGPDKQPQDPHIGYFAREGRDLLRHEDGAVVIIAERPVMQQTLQQRGRTTMTICDVTFCEIMRGLVEGAAFCFDDQAYARFLKPACEFGLPLKGREVGEAEAAGEPAIRLQLDFEAAGDD